MGAGPARYNAETEAIGKVAKLIMARCGPTRTSRDVRLRAAIPDIADAKHA